MSCLDHNVHQYLKCTGIDFLAKYLWLETTNKHFDDLFLGKLTIIPCWQYLELETLLILQICVERLV